MLTDEIEYIENMENTGGLYVYPNTRETHFLATLFKDYGTMVNKGGDQPLIKNLKRKPRQRNW